MTPRPEQIYDSTFFREVEALSVSSAVAAVPHVLAAMPAARRVTDVGSGEGAWAAQFLAHGCEVIAVDGHYVDRARLRVPEEAFIAHDLRKPLPAEVVGWGADLCVCLEVAEHLPPSRGPSLVTDLCRSAGQGVLFSAAVPGQGGHGHVNERPPEYWITLFEGEGFVTDTELQQALADESGVAWWYTQNIMLAVRSEPR